MSCPSYAKQASEVQDSAAISSLAALDRHWQVLGRRNAIKWSVLSEGSTSRMRTVEVTAIHSCSFDRTSVRPWEILT